MQILDSKKFNLHAFCNESFHAIIVENKEAKKTLEKIHFTKITHKNIRYEKFALERIFKFKNKTIFYCSHCTMI